MPSKDTADAIALLKADHRKVEGLFEQFEKAKDNARKQKLAQEICTELTVHATIEEEIFYPACKEAVEDDLEHEAYVEHDGAKVLIAEIAQGNPEDEFYDAKVTVLSEMIKHHVKEEEKPGEGFFAQARKGDVDMEALGGTLKARKEQLLAAIKQGGSPRRKPAASRATSLSRAMSWRPPTRRAAAAQRRPRQARPSSNRSRRDRAQSPGGVQLEAWAQDGLSPITRQVSLSG